MKKAVTSDEWRAARATLVMGLIAGILLPLAGCSRRGTEATESTSYGTETGSATQAHLFTVPQEQMTHVELVTVEPTTLRRVLRLTGSVAYNSFETTPVITQVSGPVSRILASPGEIVGKGQAMLEVASPDYAQARTTYLKTRDAYDLANKTYARSQDLYNHHAVALADLQQAESARNQAQADLEAATEALKVLGIQNPARLAQDPVSAEIPVLAPITGEVVERLVGPGQVVTSGATQVFTISNLKTVWVLANVYERDLGYVHVGDAVAIQTEAYPLIFHGRISYIASALDPSTRTLQVRIVTDNPGERLKKDMYVTATVAAGAISNALTVPDAAILRTPENQPFVYVAAAGNQFAQRLVTVGESQNGRTQVLSGLKAGEHVAADGSLFLQFANSLQR